jgi:RNA polymerase sigma-70 factor (ECF subfamily)
MSSDECADELSLVRAAANGDATAFARLYDAYYERVTRRLSHLLGPTSNVDDVLQETFLRAMRALRQFRGERPFRHWLLRIAMSAARDEQRRSRRAIWRLFSEPDQIEQARSSDVRDAERYADLVAVHRALRQLSPRLREVVILFELEGESLADIAAQLSLSTNTVASRLRRGRERLRAALERSGYADFARAAPMMPVRRRT